MMHHHLSSQEVLSVYSAVKQFQFPLTPFRDRVDEQISIDIALSGHRKLSIQDKESYIEEHGKTMKYPCNFF